MANKIQPCRALLDQHQRCHNVGRGGILRGMYLAGAGYCTYLLLSASHS